MTLLTLLFIISFNNFYNSGTETINIFCSKQYSYSFYQGIWVITINLCFSPENPVSIFCKTTKS